MSYLKIQGVDVRVTNLDKIIWPKTNTTKGQMIEYYIKASPLLLPGLKGRPISMQRFPHGVISPGFYQKNCPDNAPQWVNTYTIERGSGKSTNYVLIENLPTLIWLVNLGVIEFHPWLSSVGSLDNPDYAVFDLDPMEIYGIDEVRLVAITIGDLLAELGLKGMVKTSGSTGLQIFVPLKPIYTYQQVRDFVHLCCTVVNRIHPDWTTLERNVKNRQGKIYLDYMQNAREQTIVAAYSLRPRENPTFSMPLSWEYVRSNKVNPLDFNIGSFMDGLETLPWLQGLVPQTLDAAVGKLQTKL